MFPQQTQQKQPWWKSAAAAGGAIGNALTGQQQNPIGQLGQSAGEFGGALKSFLDKRRMAKANQPIQDDAGTMNPPSLMGDGGPTAPEYAADGKIVTKPTLVLLAEHEPEAVVPLSNRPDAKVRPSVMQGRRYYGED